MFDNENLGMECTQQGSPHNRSQREPYLVQTITNTFWGIYTHPGEWSSASQELFNSFHKYKRGLFSLSYFSWILLVVPWNFSLPLSFYVTKFSNFAIVALHLLYMNDGATLKNILETINCHWIVTRRQFHKFRSLSFGRGRLPY